MVPKVGKIKSDVSPHLNIRNEPDPTSVEVAEFDPGTEFLILGEVEGKSYRVRGVTQKNWYKIQFINEEAFAAAGFVEIVDSPTGNVKSDVTPHLRGRSQPRISPSVSIVTNLLPGTEFDILDQVEGDSYTYKGSPYDNWYKIRYDSREMFVAAAFVNVPASGTGSTGVLPLRDDSLVIRALEAQIRAGRIIFDPQNPSRPDYQSQLLGRTTSANAKPKVRRLVLKLSQIEKIRISSIVRNNLGDRRASDHFRGEAVDIGNEEIGGTLLPAIITPTNIKEFDLDQVIFDASVVGQTPAQKWNLNKGRKFMFGAGTLAQHRNHIHISVMP